MLTESFLTSRKYLVNSLMMIGISLCLLFFAVISSYSILVNSFLYWYEFIRYIPYGFFHFMWYFFQFVIFFIIFFLILVVYISTKIECKEELCIPLKPYSYVCILCLLLSIFISDIPAFFPSFSPGFNFYYRSLPLIFPSLIILILIVLSFFGKIIKEINEISKQYAIIDRISIKPLKYSTLCSVFITSKFSLILLLLKLKMMFWSFLFSYMIFCIVTPTLFAVFSGFFVEYPLQKIEKVQIYSGLQIREFSEITKNLIDILNAVRRYVGFFFIVFKRIFPIIDKLRLCPSRISQKYLKFLKNIRWQEIVRSDYFKKLRGGMKTLKAIVAGILAIIVIINVIIIANPYLISLILETIPLETIFFVIVAGAFIPLYYASKVYKSLASLPEKLGISAGELKLMIETSILELLNEILNYLEQVFNKKVILSGITKENVARFMSYKQVPEIKPISIPEPILP